MAKSYYHQLHKIPITASFCYSLNLLLVQLYPTIVTLQDGYNPRLLNHHLFLNNKKLLLHTEIPQMWLDNPLLMSISCYNNITSTHHFDLQINFPTKSSLLFTFFS